MIDDRCPYCDSIIDTCDCQEELEEYNKIWLEYKKVC
jgi:hypothetical protein